MEKKFGIKTGSCLCIKNISAKITIRAGKEGQIKISVTGDNKSIKQVSIYRESLTQVVIDGSRLSPLGVVSNTNPSVRILNNIVSNSSITINGVSINGINTTVVPVLLVIEVIVPKGTNLNCCCNDLELNSCEVDGNLDLNLSGKSMVKITDSKNVKIESNGSSDIRIHCTKGNANLTANGGSYIFVSGEFENIIADTYGCGGIDISGNYKNITTTGKKESINLY